MCPGRFQDASHYHQYGLQLYLENVGVFFNSDANERAVLNVADIMKDLKREETPAAILSRKN